MDTMTDIVEGLLAHACEALYAAERAGDAHAITVARAQHDVLAQAIARYENEEED